uniref:Uncharacterized protein n=1 Tax=Eutreptiella gymnastica TaxID=73025 RepID=A0A7S4CM89_9EUGL
MALAGGAWQTKANRIAALELHSSEGRHGGRGTNCVAADQINLWPRGEFQSVPAQWVVHRTHIPWFQGRPADAHPWERYLRRGHSWEGTPLGRGNPERVDELRYDFWALPPMRGHARRRCTVWHP